MSIENIFSKRSFQEKVIQALILDKFWAQTFVEIFNPGENIDSIPLKAVASLYLEHHSKYKEFPSSTLLKLMISEKYAEPTDMMLKAQAISVVEKVEKGEDIGDLSWVKEKALEFCKHQNMNKALVQSADLIRSGNYEKVVDLMKVAISAGIPNSLGHDYNEDFEARYSQTFRSCIGTGIPELDSPKILNGGLGAGEVGIVIAPTGCHAINTPILMFDGSWKMVQDIEVWDKLMGPDSTPRTVLRLVRGKEQMFEIVPAKGKSFVVNGGHILSLKRSGGKTNKLGEIVNVSVNEWLKKTNSFRQNHKLWRAEGGNFPVLKTDSMVSFEIVPRNIDDFYGFTVDRDNLYVMDDYFVTHNCGKSHLLVNFACSALSQGKNVIYYSLELSEQLIGIRFDSHFTGISSSDCIKSKDAVRQALDSLKPNLGRLIIKEYPTRSATVNTIRNHIERQTYRGFIPDLILVDYAGILRSIDKYELPRLEMQYIIQDLRRMAKELHIPVWTALQSNREGAKAEFVDITSLSESFGPAMDADFLLGLQRPRENRQTGFGNIFIAKNRFGIDGVKYPIHLDTARSKLTIVAKDDEDSGDGNDDSGSSEDSGLIVKATKPTKNLHQLELAMERVKKNREEYSKIGNSRNY